MTKFIIFLKTLRKEAEQKSGLNGIQSHHPAFTNAVFYHLSYQANWEQA